MILIRIALVSIIICYVFTSLQIIIPVPCGAFIFGFVLIDKIKYIIRRENINSFL